MKASRTKPIPIKRQILQQTIEYCHNGNPFFGARKLHFRNQGHCDASAGNTSFASRSSKFLPKIPNDSKTPIAIYSGLRSRSVELELSQVKKQRQTERNADEENRDDRQPKQPHSESFPFRLNERNQHNRGDDYVQPEERADPVGKQILHEDRHVQSAMLHDPRDEFRIRENQSNHREREIKVPAFHRWISRQRLPFVEEKCEILRRWQ